MAASKQLMQLSGDLNVIRRSNSADSLSTKAELRSTSTREKVRLRAEEVFVLYGLSIVLVPLAKGYKMCAFVANSECGIDDCWALSIAVEQLCVSGRVFVTNLRNLDDPTGMKMKFNLGFGYWAQDDYGESSNDWIAELRRGDKKDDEINVDEDDTLVDEEDDQEEEESYNEFPEEVNEVPGSSWDNPVLL